MNCLRCGREVADDQAFCPQCLELMEKHPVRPDIVVKLPQRRDPSIKKTPPRKKAPSAEEQVARLKIKNRWLTVILCVILAAFLLLLSITIDYFRQLDVQKILGQNYSTMETTN